MLYLSDYKKYPKSKNVAQLSGIATIDSWDSSLYRTVKYNLSIEDTYTDSIYECRFTVTHDSLSTQVTEFDVIQNDNLDIAVDAVYANVVGGYPTTFDVQVTFPANFNGSWVVDKEVSINHTQIQKDGLSGPSSGIYPSEYLYPNT